MNTVKEALAFIPWNVLAKECRVGKTTIWNWKKGLTEPKASQYQTILNLLERRKETCQKQDRN